MKRICLVTQGHLATNPRLIKEADAFAEAGYDVSIIAADFSAWAREEDRTFAGRRWQVVKKVQFGPDAPLLTRGWHFLRQRAAVQLFSAGRRSPSVSHAAVHVITPDLVAIARRLKAELYVAHYPAALPAAAIAAREHRALFAFDAEDFHLGELPECAAQEQQRELIRAVEGRYLKDCAYISAAAPGIAESYAQCYEIRNPVVVLNVFPRSHAPDRPSRSGTAKPGPSIYWFSRTIGPHRGLECAVRAMARAETRPHLYLRGTPAVGYLDHLRRIAADVGASDRLHVLPPESPESMVRLAAHYDIGYAGEPGDTPNSRILLSNKLFSYLLAGVPSVASSLPSHVALSKELGRAMRLFTVDDPESLALEIDALLGDPEALAAARAWAFNLGQTRFNWDTESKKLLQSVAAVLDDTQCRSRRASSAGQ